MLISLPAGYQMDSVGNIRYTGPRFVVGGIQPQAQPQITSLKFVAKEDSKWTTNS